jgi:uncharacterized C2H2 Zn-finger protein
MIVKSKERKEIFFKDVKVGQVFREHGEEDVYMKVSLEDDFICCPRCDEDIHINDVYKNTKEYIALINRI